MHHRSADDRITDQPPRPSVPGPVVAWVVAAVAAYAVGIALAAGHADDVGYQRYELWRLVCCAVGVVGVLDGVRRHHPRHAGPWLALAALIASWAVRPIKDLWLVGDEQPYLGGWYFLAQVSATGVAFVGALWWFLRHRRATRDTEALFDVAIMVAAYGAFLIHVSVVPGWGFFPDATPFRVGAGVVFPLSMLVVLTLASYLVFIDKVPGRSFALLGAAVASTVLPNLLTLLVQTSSAVTEVAIDTAPLTIFLFCAAAADPSMVVLTEASTGGRGSWSTPRSILLGIAFALPVAGLLTGDRPHGVELAVVVALFAAAGIALTLRARRAVDGLTVAEQSSRRAAATDALTGLMNRRGFLEHLGAEPDRVLGIAFVDLDRFKQYNDAHGHTAGDRLLRAVGERIALASDGWPVARLGGDEFAVAYRAPLEHSDAAQLAEVGDHLARRLLDAIAEPLTTGARSVAVTASIGLAEGLAESRRVTDRPVPGLREATVSDLLRRADLAQYEAKSLGGAQVRRFSDHLDHAVQREVRVIDALQQGADSELHVVYQAIVRTSDQVVVGAEALARLRSDQLGNIPAGEFIRAAEEHGAIVPLGRRLLELVVADLLAVRAELPDGFRVSLNVSPLQLEARDGTQRLEALARSEPEVVAHLRVEVTESALATAVAREALLRLSGAGYQIAIDDFGTDYASLQYLATMPVDVLKLDRAFVADATERPIDQAIIRHVVELANEVGIEVVAEGVETTVQSDLLVQLGCQYGQGFLWDRPAVGLARLLRPAASASAGRVEVARPPG